MRSFCLLAVALVAGCRTPRVAPEGEHSAKAVVLSVPLSSQAGGGNGALGAVRLLLRTYGADLDAEAAERFPEESLATLSARELRDYLRGRGFAAEVFGGELSDRMPRGLLAYLAQGHPAVLELEDGFVLAYGFDPVARKLLVDDPRRGRREIAYDALAAPWSASGRLLLVAPPRAATRP